MGLFNPQIWDIFPFFKVFFSFFEQCFSVFAVLVFISLVIAISIYSFGHGYKWNYLLLSFYCLLMVYRNTANFGVLIFYPESLLNSFFTLLDFLDLEGISSYKIMSSAKGNSFTSFPMWMPFIQWLIGWFWFLIALAGTSSTIFNHNGKSWHSCLLCSIKRDIILLK